MDSPPPDTSRPGTLFFSLTGERFDFLTSAKSGDGVFRFRWTLDAGRKGPPEHIHDRETESFEVLEGTLRVWIRDDPHDLGPGGKLQVPPGVRHRFLNPGTTPAVVKVSLDGCAMEDSLVPLAVYLQGRSKFGLRDMLVMTVHDDDVRSGRSSSAFFDGVGRGLAAVLRACGVRPLPRHGAWA